MKPAVYLAALADPKHRYTLITPLDDSPLTWREPGRPAWTPKNYDKANHGMVPLRTALAHSYNIPTARIGLELGITGDPGALRSRAARSTADSAQA